MPNQKSDEPNSGGSSSAPSIVAGPVQNVIIATGPGWVELTWDAVEGAASFEIQTTENLESGNWWQGSALQRQFTIHEISPGIKLFIRVRAYDRSGNPGPWSDIVSHTA